MHLAPRSSLPLTAGAIALITCPIALAQDDPDASAPEESAIHWTISPRFRYQFDTGLDAGNGDYRVFRGGIGAKANWAATDKVQLTFGLGYEYNKYDFDRPNSFIAGTADPFSDIHILDLGLTAYVATDSDWSWFAGIRGRLAGESGVDISDAGTIGGVGGASWNMGEGRSIGVGMLVSSQIEDDVQVLPIFNINWRFNEQWRFASSGAMGEFIMALDEQSELGFGAAWENRRFRLDDSAPQLAAVVEDTGVPVFVRYSYRPSDSVALNVIGGVTLFQSFEVSNRNGNATRDFDADPSAFIGMNVSIGF